MTLLSKKSLWIFLLVLMLAGLLIYDDRPQVTLERSEKHLQWPSTCFDWMQKTPEQWQFTVNQMADDLYKNRLIQDSQLTCLKKQLQQFRRILEENCRLKTDDPGSLVTRVIQQWIATCPLPAPLDASEST